MSVLEASSAPCLSTVAAGAATALPDGAVVTKALSPTDWRFVRRAHGGERDLADVLAGGEHGAVAADRDLARRDALGDRDLRLDEAAEAGHEAAVAVDVQVTVARQRLAAVGELDLDEALALDADVERVAGLAQAALLRTCARSGRCASRCRAARCRTSSGARPARRGGPRTRRGVACSRWCSHWPGRSRRHPASAAAPACLPLRFGVLRALVSRSAEWKEGFSR